jgi:hypothetical protein
MIEIQKVKSSWIESLGYDEEDGELHVKFRHGRGVVKAYIYVMVPREVYEKMLRAESVGRYYQTHIKDVYEWRLGDEPDQN